jgi:hypothetical protein
MRTRISSGTCALSSALILALAGASLAQDCNSNDVPDDVEVFDRLELSDPAFFLVGSEPVVIVLADFDGDGRLDLAASNHRSDTVSVLRNESAAGVLSFGRSVDRCVVDEPRGLDGGDLDGDGRLDIACGGERSAADLQPPPRVQVLVGDGRGGFAPSCPPPCGPGLPPACAASELVAHESEADAIRTLVLADVDADGDLDVVNGFRDPEGLVTVLFNRDGRGTFSQPRRPNSAPLRETRYIAVGDLDLDGSLDVATAGGEVLLGPLRESVEVAERRLVLGEVETDAKGIALADLDGDGDLDAAIARTAPVLRGVGGGQVLVFENRGAEVFERRMQPTLDGLCDLQEGLATADLDGDGDLDLVATLAGRAPEPCEPQGVLVLVNAGPWVLERGPLVATGAARPRWVAAGDLDGDSMPDLAVALDADLDQDRVAIVRNRTAPVSDRDENGVLDRCQFFRGDVDEDARLGLSDAVRILNFLFRGGPAPRCVEAADADDSGRVDLTDAVSLLLSLFLGGAAPPPPRLGAGGACAWPEPWTDPNGILGPCVPRCVQ